MKLDTLSSGAAQNIQGRTPKYEVALVAQNMLATLQAQTLEQSLILWRSYIRSLDHDHDVIIKPLSLSV